MHLCACSRGDSDIAARIQSASPQPFYPVSHALDSKERGALLFKRYGCHLCHGKNAEGGFKNPNSETGGVIGGLTKVAEGYT
ncbi:MAG: hypothetical protein D6719_00535, partial [Candidatus Dadabacteria bacterium]